MLVYMEIAMTLFLGMRDTELIKILLLPYCLKMLADFDVMNVNIDDIIINNAEYCCVRGRADVRDPGLKLNLTLNNAVSINVCITQEDLTYKDLVYINALTQRDAELIRENVPLKVLSDGSESHFYTNSPQVQNIARRFIKALNDLDGEHFQAGEKMAI